MPDTPSAVAASYLELILLLGGLWLLWRYVLRPRARSTARPSPLAAWELPVPDFLLNLFAIGACAMLASFVAGVGMSQLQLAEDTRTTIASAAFQLGLLVGATGVLLYLRRPDLRQAMDRTTLLSGLATFVISLPIVTGVNFAWLGILKLTGLPADQQDLLRLFEQADSPVIIGAMIVLATIVAPISEELLFRAIFFRYLRTRISRWLALLLPSTIFAALHVNWTTLDGLAGLLPLATLAVVFSLAYERTGRIGTVIVAHALFNLHTIVLLFSGVTQ